MHQLIIFGAVCLAAMLLVILAFAVRDAEKALQSATLLQKLTRWRVRHQMVRQQQQMMTTDDTRLSADEESQQSKPLKSAKSNVPAASTPKLPSPKESARKSPSWRLLRPRVVVT